MKMLRLQILSYVIIGAYTAECSNDNMSGEQIERLHLRGTGALFAVHLLQ
jgi:hypothetical protein